MNTHNEFQIRNLLQRSNSLQDPGLRSQMFERIRMSSIERSSLNDLQFRLSGLEAMDRARTQIAEWQRNGLC